MSKKDKDNLADLLNKPYEENDLGTGAIVGTGVAILALIGVALLLMWILQYKIFAPAAEEAQRKETLPMALSEKDRLPPEPRLQSAPGFGIDSPKGRVNLELREPQAEYRELTKIWNEEVANGSKNPDGSVVTLPVDEAKAKAAAAGFKSRSGADADAAFSSAGKIITEASAGRVTGVKRR